MTSDLMRAKISLSRIGFPSRTDVTKSRARALALYAGLGVGYIAQSGGFRRIGIGGDDVWLIHYSRKQASFNNRIIAPNAPQAGNSAALGKSCCSRPRSPSYFIVLLKSS